ncbi:MAG: amino acid ABC transporter substrate-binding protein [Alphaproteobacteria bacterium]|nr:amino acid ABC transporter substrate-binding protein [Alphaproteobacteria bacterium]
MALVFTCVLLALSACKPSETAPNDASPSSDAAYDRVLSSGTLRCGYILYPPNLMRDPATGDFSGIFYDLTQDLARRLNFKVEWVEEVSWATYIEGLKLHRYDAMCSGAWSSAAEGRMVGYSRPIFYSPYYVYVRSDDMRFDDDLNKLNDQGVVFSVGDGRMGSIIASADFPRAKQYSIPQASDDSQMIMNLTTLKGDATLLEPYSASLFLKSNPGTLRPLRFGNPVRVFPTRYILPLGDTKMQNMFDSALEEMMNSGVIDPIITRYELFPGSFLRVAKPYQIPPTAP